MEHSDELTFADYFNAERRNLSKYHLRRPLLRGGYSIMVS